MTLTYHQMLVMDINLQFALFKDKKLESENEF